MKTNGIGKRSDFANTTLEIIFLVVCLALPFSATLLPAQEAGGATALTAPNSAPSDAAHSPDEALQRLMDGNQRYCRNAATRPEQTPDRRTQLAVGQQPFAIILGCSDSRVPPEIIFDQGLGDLFVVRVAGNVLDDEGIGSLEYAVEHLHAPLIVVLGHTKCGAVSAAVSGEPVPGHIRAIVRSLKPAVRSTRGLPGDPVELAVKANVQRAVAQLKNTKPILAGHLKEGTLKIVGGCYDLSSGAVELVP